MWRNGLGRWGLGAALALLTGGHALAQGALQASDDAPAPVAETAAPLPSGRVPLEEIQRFVSLFNTVRDGYVDEVADRALMTSAIRGLLLGLDPHSVYLEKTTADELAESASGSYGGVGIEVLYLPDGWIRVIAPIDGTPAARAGLRAGDTIIAIDGEALVPERAGRDHLRGAPGTTVVLSVLRDGRMEPLEIPIVRDVIRLVSVRGRMLEPGYGYIRLSAFQLDTAEAFRAAVQELNAAAGGQLHGLVIDLRSNPGGVLTGAVEIADDLLDAGVIVSTRGRLRVNDTEFVATPGDLLNGAPLVLIVDAGSASAAEVLAGALGDNGRARIIGSRTFGKGSVQSLLPLDNGDAVKLTISRYYTPSGRSIQARGIDPDVVLHADGTIASDTDSGGLLLSEAVLPGHLRGELEDGRGAGEVLDGEAPIAAALAELKAMSAAAEADAVTESGD